MTSVASRRACVEVEEVLFDARSLQRHARGADRLSGEDAALLTAIRHRDWPHPRPRLIGLVDHALEPLREHHRLLFDEVTINRRRPGRGPRWFMSSTSVMQDPVWVSAILFDGSILKVAIIRETAANEELDDHLSRLRRQADDLTCLAWLDRYDLFAVGSESVRADLEHRRSIAPSKILVTGRGVRGHPRTRAGGSAGPLAARRHILVTIDESVRGDLENAVAAHARSTTRRRFPLVIVGRCPTEVRAELRKAYARDEGDQDALRFIDEPSEADLDNLRADAAMTLILSRRSDIAINLAAESAALGTPALLFEDGTPREGAVDFALRLPRGDREALVRSIDALGADETIWEKACAGWRAGGEPLAVDVAARRTLDLLVERAGERPPAPGLNRGARAQLAMLTPLPPQGSGVAARSIAEIEALSLALDVHLFCDTPNAVQRMPVQSCAPVRALEISPQRFDASLSVLGNSRRHADAFEYLIDHGGAALTRDAHLIGFYAETFGPDRTLDVLRAEHCGVVSPDNIAGWVRDPRGMPTLFLSEVVRAAAPLLMTSEIARSETVRLYGIEPRRVPLLQHRHINGDALSPEARGARRRALGWKRDELVLCSFGLSFPAVAVAVWALRMLLDWRLAARLVLCGTIDDADRANIAALMQELGLAHQVTQALRGPWEHCCSNHLIAADIALQLQTHALSGPSDDIMGCIAAALPTIANDQAASAVEAPSFIRRIPDALSPVLIAEAALDIMSSGQHRARPLDEARAFAATHAPARYAHEMTEALGLDSRRT